MEETNANWRINKAPHGKEIARCKERERERERERQRAAPKGRLTFALVLVFFLSFFVCFFFHFFIIFLFISFFWCTVGGGFPLGLPTLDPIFARHSNSDVTEFLVVVFFLLPSFPLVPDGTVSFLFVFVWFPSRILFSTLGSLGSTFGVILRATLPDFVFVFCFGVLFFCFHFGRLRSAPTARRTWERRRFPVLSIGFCISVVFSLFFFVFISVSTSSFLVTELFFVCYHVLVQLVSFFRGFDWSDRIYWVLLTFTGLYWF